MDLISFTPSLQPATLIRRYKRFLADVTFPDGTALTAHTPNTGSMMGCAEPGMRVWLRHNGEGKRKYPWSWEASETEKGVLVGVNTALPNRLVSEAIRADMIESLRGYAGLRQEVPYGTQNSRIDVLLESHERRCYVEIKNVTACDNGAAFFPDAVTARGLKHLQELTEMVRLGARGVIFFCVQRDDARSVRPADEIDPAYGQGLRQALRSGVEALAYKAVVTPRGVRIGERLPVNV